MNTTGALIGVNSQIISTTGGNIGLGFAMPSNMARTVMDQLIKRGKVQRGHLGVGGQSEPEGARRRGGDKVENGSLAAKAGIQPGDAITLNGKPIADANSFRPPM